MIPQIFILFYFFLFVVAKLKALYFKCPLSTLTYAFQVGGDFVY